jgi:hypothetical protein
MFRRAKRERATRPGNARPPGGARSEGEEPPDVLLAIGADGFALLLAGVTVGTLRDGQLGQALAFVGLATTVGSALVFLTRLAGRREPW